MDHGQQCEEDKRQLAGGMEYLRSEACGSACGIFASSPSSRKWKCLLLHAGLR